MEGDLTIVSDIFNSNLMIQGNGMSSDWSQLPKELVDEIAERVYSNIELLRFRSVCSLWRKTSIPVSHHGYCFPYLVSDPNKWGNLPVPIPECSFNENIDYETKPLNLCKRMTYSLSLPTKPQEVWIINMQQEAHMSYLVNPFSGYPIKPLPSSFPKVLDLLHVHVFELAEEYVLYHDSGIHSQRVIFSLNTIWNTPVIITITTFSGILVLFRFRDEKWSIIDNEWRQNSYEDVLLYKDKFYAVDYMGRTVVICHDLTVEEVASSLLSGGQDRTRLIESDGELLLVITCVSWKNAVGAIYQSVHYIKVFKLDWDNGKWIEVTSLSDRVLFLGNNCSFSASTSEFSGCEGNCIYFTSDDKYCGTDEHPFESPWLCVYNIVDGSIGTLASNSGYSKMFWPPPAWRSSATS